MPDASEILSSLHRRGIKVWIDKEQLHLQAPTGMLLPEELQELRILKVEIIELLRQTEFDIQPRPPGCTVPLTPMQMFSWNYAEQGRASERTCRTALRVQGNLNTRSLERSLEAVIERHQSLRTRIVCIDGTPTQQIDAACGACFKEIDLSGLSALTVEEEAKRIAEEFLREKFDLSVGPLFAARLLRLSSHEFILILALDHVISDAVSVEILSKEIWTLYRQAEQGLPFSIPKPVQFADYVVWQQLTYGTWLKQHEAYWRQRLAGATRIPLVPKYRLLDAERPGGLVLNIPFGDTLSAKLRELARREKIQLAIVIFSIFTAVMLRWCKQNDLVIKFLISGRHHSKLENMIGVLSEFVHVRIAVTQKTSFLDLLRQGSLEFHSAFEHHDSGRVPEFMPEWAWQLDFTDIKFQWAPSSTEPGLTEKGPSQANARDGISIQPIAFTVVKPVDFLPYFYDSPGGIGCYVMYRPDVFAPGAVERFGRHLQTCGQELVERPFARVNSILLR